MGISKIGFMLLLQANCKFYGKATGVQRHTPFSKRLTDGRDQTRGNVTNGPDFSLSSMWMHITWKHSLFHLNKQ